ncbi:MAG: 1,2-phenylacetyl-CoA epoxidase subunit PaaC, partial [Ferruginibacter sp.]|nr:1,2-phenylacetyl-CoA epoxidase subunit PaaC [Ferruginibacter sp.]
TSFIQHKTVSEDTLAYLRTEREFKNCLLTEQPNGDWAKTILRQFFFSCYQYYFYTELQQSEDSRFAALAVKSLKEVSYHLRWSSEWVIRLGDGTGESRKRLSVALEELWAYTGELFHPAPYEQALLAHGLSVNLPEIKNAWETRVKEILTEATLDLPANSFMQSGGKTGIHTEHMGYILSEMQYLQRTYPGAEW